MNRLSNWFYGLFFVAFILAVFGWCNNIYLLFTSESLAGLEVARAVGIFVAPLGAVLGFF